MLSDTILNELFNVQYQVNDVVLDHVSEELSRLGFKVLAVKNYDCAIYFMFNRLGVSGELRVDRVFRCFEISAVKDDHTYATRRGDWTDMKRCLDILRKE